MKLEGDARSKMLITGIMVGARGGGREGAPIMHHVLSFNLQPADRLGTPASDEPDGNVVEVIPGDSTERFGVSWHGHCRAGVHIFW